MKLAKKANKILSIIATASMLIFSAVPARADLAAPTPPPAPTAPPASTPPPAPTAPPEPTPPPDIEPTPPPAPTPPPDPTPFPTPTPSPDASSEDTSPSPSPSSSPQASTTDSGSTSSGGQTGGASADGQTEDPSIQTGDATNDATIINNGNNNVADGGSTSTTESGGIKVTNDGNGTDSTNTGSATIIDESNTTQDNSAKVINDLNQATETGSNSTSGNVGDSNIQSGDANTSGTLITAVNTNVDGVAVAEFNVVDDHVGDIILDFDSNCISGCSAGSTSVENTGNGADSTNTGNVETILVDNSFQNNDADVENNMLLDSDSGENKANMNVGDSNIQTGDANVSANSLTFANNNLEGGGVIYGVVNIYGDLVGDIIFPEEYYGDSCCNDTTTLANTDNGANSTNTGNYTNTQADNTNQSNTANITNNLSFDATTGDNVTNQNTGGTSSVSSGDANIDAQVLNIANSNLVGGNWWLVIVNEAGRWVGKIIGEPEGASYAGSEGTEFYVNEHGEITVVNAGNGAGSENTGNVSQNSTTNTTQTNQANIVNNLNLSANTGGNSASMNTGGDSSIQTGDAQIIANLVNFVNNNFSGGGQLYVTVINVFGSWIGDFIGPGQTKSALAQASSGQTLAVGGVGSSESSSSNSSSTAASSVQAAVASIVTSSSETSILSNVNLSLARTSAQQTPPEASVQGAATQARKVFNINLAWLLPFALIYLLLRNRSKLSALLLRKRR